MPFRLSFSDVSYPSDDILAFQTQETFERLTEDFAISRGVTIPTGAYVFRRQRFEWRSADKRPVVLRLWYEWGHFYSGRRDDWIARVDLRPGPYFFLGAEYQQNDGRLPEGNFIVRLIRLWVSIALNPDVSWFNFIQYDTISEVLGLNSRFRWIIEPGNTDEFRFPFWRNSGKADQYGPARTEKILTKDHFTKVLVCGHQQCQLFISSLQNFFVRDPCVYLSYIQHLVAVLPKSLNNRTIDAFIREEIHAAFSGGGVRIASAA